MNDASFTILDIDRVQESSTNPRQHFDDKGMAELTESIKTKGIVSPILVRMVNSHYEVVDGARRYRAARAAGLENVPVIVRQFSDEEALEIQVIANLQRQDVHPLDAAEGYKRLLDTKRYDVAALAAKVGKSTSYIHQRLALNGLVPEVKKALWAETLTAAHGTLLARLQADDQREIFKDMTRFGNDPWTIKRLRRHIEEDVMCVLDAVGFDKKDPLLLTKAGACTVCPKRSGFNKELFNDITTKDRCTDPGCFNAKCEAHIARAEAQSKANKIKTVRISVHTYSRDKKLVSRSSYSGDNGWRPAKKGCPSPLAGIIAEGEGIGKVMQVCTTITCKTCNPGGKKNMYSSSPAKTITPAARYKRRMENWENKVQQVAREEARRQLLPHITTKFTGAELTILLREVYERNHGGEIPIAKLVRVGVPKKQYMRTHSIDEWVKATKNAPWPRLAQLLYGMLLEREMVHDPSAATPERSCLEMLIFGHAKDKVNLERLEKVAREQLAKSKPKPPKKDKPAGKKTKKEVKDDE